MRLSPVRALFCLSIVLAACSTNVDATNPYDPASANPAAGSVIGKVVAQGRLSSEGIRVFLEAAGAEVAHGDSGADGGFLIGPVAPGRYDLAIREQGFYEARIFRLEVAVGETVDLGVINLQSLASGTDASVISGKALFEGRADHAGIVVAARGTTFHALSGPDGSYALTLAEGTYDLEFSAPEWSPVQRAAVVVVRGETLTLDPVTLTQAPATITGVVLRRSCTPDPADETTDPAEGALVAAVGSGATAVADSQGQFRLTGLPGGTWAVRATLDGQDPGDSFPVSVRGGETVALAEELVLDAARGAVIGHVRLTDRVDHAGTLVQLTGVPGLSTVTAQDGAFRLRDVCAGEGYALGAWATQDGFLPGVASGITVVSGQDSAPVELLLAPQEGGLVLADGADSVAALTISYSLEAPTGTTEMRLAFEEFADPDAGWVPYQGSGQRTLPDQDGSQTVYAQLRGGGAVSAIFRDTVVLDRVAPTSPEVVIEGGGAYSNDPDGAVTLTLSASDTAVAPVDRTSGLAWMKLLPHDLQGGGPAPSDPADPRWSDPAAAPQLTYQRTVDQPLLRPNVDEAKELWIRFGDQAGNWSDPVSAGVTLDREAPDGAAVSIVTATPGFANDSRVQLLLTVSDENPGVQVRVSGSSTFLGAVLQPVQAPPTLTWDLPQVDGPQTVWVQYGDLAGNLGVPLSATIELDRQPPTGVRLSVVQAPYSSTRSVELALAAQSATEVLVSLQPDFTDAAGLPEAWVPFTGSLPLTLPAVDGPHVIYGKFRDAAHNESVPLSATITLDTVPPVVSALSVLEGRTVADPAVNVAVTALAGPLDAYELRVDVQDSPPGGTVTTGGWQPFNPAVPVTLPAPDGEKELQLYLRDAAGNVSALPGTARVTLDTVAPTLIAVELDGGATWTSNPSLLLTVDAVGADQVVISNRADFAGSSWQPLTDPNLAWTLPATDGTHTVFVRVRDLAGNEVSSSAQIGLDLTGPQPVSVTIDGGAAYSGDLLVDLVLSATDALSGVVLAEVDTEGSFTGSTAIPWGGAGSQPLPGFLLDPQEGSQTVHVRFHDAAGNSATATASIRVDTEAPSGTLLIAGGAAYTQAAAVILGFSAPVDAIQMKVVDGAVPSCAPPLQPFAAALPWTLPAGDGTKVVSVCFVDVAQHTGTATASIVLDTENPSGTLQVNGGAPFSTSRNVSLGLASAADVTGMAVANAAILDCTTATYEPFSTPRTWTLTAGDGTKNLAACFRDGAGRTASATASVILDGAAPAGTVALDGGAAYSRDSTVDVTLTAADGGSGLARYELASDPSFGGATPVVWPGGASTTVNGVALISGDGPRTVYARFTDQAGNQLQAAATVVVDSAPPAGTIAINGGAAYTQVVGVTATLTAPADTAQLKVVDGAVPSCALPLSGYTGSVPRTLPVGDGPKSLSACFVDLAGNTATATATIVLDTQSPSGTASLDGGAAYTRDREVTLALTASADVSLVAVANAVTLDCATAMYEPLIGQRAWTLAAGDGPKNVAVCFKDASGRTGTTAAAITLDGTAPAAGLVLAGGATYSRFSTVVVELTFSSDVNGYAVRNDALDCATATYTAVTVGNVAASVAAHPLAPGQGTKTVVGCVRDVAGNLSQASDSIVLDSEVPTSEQVSLSPSGTINTTAVIATLAASGAVEMCLYGDLVGGSNDSCIANGWVALSSSAALTLTGPDGTKQVSAFFRDAAGNVSARAATSVALDRTLPVVANFAISGLARSGPSTTVTRSQTVLVDLSGWTEPGLDAIQLSENGLFTGAAWQPFSTSVPFALSGGDATKTVFGRARDAAGNVSLAASGAIVLDQTAPAGGTVVIDADAPFTNAPAPHTVAVNFTIGGAAVQWSPDGGAWTDCATNPCAPASPGQTVSRDLPAGDGPKQLSLYFRDEAGNVSSPLSDSIVLDRTPPSSVRLRSVSPRTTSMFVDIEVATDNFVVDHYEVRTQPPRGAPSDHLLPEHQGWITQLPALLEYDLKVRAVDGAGNAGPWLPDVAGGDAPVSTLVGLTPSVVDGAGIGAIPDRLTTWRGLSLFPGRSGLQYRLASCDSRQGACATGGFRTSQRDPSGGVGVELADVSMAVQGDTLWFFGFRNIVGDRQLEALWTKSPDTAWDLSTWNYVTLGTVAGGGFYQYGTLAAAANGKVLALAYAVNFQTIAVQVCPLSGTCTTAAEWSAPTIVQSGSLASNFPRETDPVGSITLDAGENHLWLSYPVQNGAVCTATDPSCGMQVLGCAISRTASRCTAPSDWSTVKLVHGGGTPRGGRILEAEGHVWLAAMLQPTPASGLEKGLWLWRCPITQSPTTQLCTTTASWGTPILLEPMIQPYLNEYLPPAFAGPPRPMPSRLALESWGGSLYYGTFDYNSQELRFGRCSQATSGDCMLMSGSDAINWSRSLLIRSVSPNGQAMLGIHQGNPAVFLQRDQTRVYVAEPFTAAPLQRALVPDFLSGGTRATWLDREATAADGYLVQYAAGGFGPPLDQQVTSFDITATSLDVAATGGDFHGAVMAFRDQDLSVTDPLFRARGGTRLVDGDSLQTQAGVATFSGGPRYVNTATCRVVTWASDSGAVNASTCLRAGSCADAASWTDTVLKAPRGAPFRLDDVAVAVNPTGDRLHVAYSYDGEPEDLFYQWRSLNPVTCALGAATEVKLVDAVGMPSPALAPTHLSMAASATRVYLAWARSGGDVGFATSGMVFASCAVATGCGALVNWAQSVWNIHYEGGAIFASGGNVWWAQQQDGVGGGPPTTLQLWRCNEPTLCDQPGDFLPANQHTVFTARGSEWQVKKHAVSLRAEEGRFLLTWGDQLAWCNEQQVGTCNAPEAWNRGWWSPELLAGNLPRIAMLGSVGNSYGGAIGGLAYLGLGNGGHSVARCNDRCWNPDSFQGGWTLQDGSAQFELVSNSYQFGPVGDFSAGTATFVSRTFDAASGLHHWVFHDDVFFDLLPQ